MVGEKKLSRDLDGSTSLELPEYEKVAFNIPSVCLYVRMCTSLEPEQSGGF
jgi:hypothetical protein